MANRDYGKMRGVGGTGPSTDPNKYRQVYWATHNGSGDSDVNLNRLPYMYRSFISFSFGGKQIEDFNLIATFNNDRLNRNGYADFKDNTSTYDNLDGQYYWNTHYTSNSIEFTLSTDGIEQKTLDDFLFWFKAGTIRELILAEHPNRAILARVSSPPVLNLLPFEEPVTITFSNITYDTSTTLYKGDITLKLIMDSPFWYSKLNILGILDANSNQYLNQWIDQNGNVVDIVSSKDALKIWHEDGIPLGSAIQHNMLLGNGGFANVENNIISKIWNGPLDDGEVYGAKIERNDAIAPYQFGIIAGAVITADGTINSLAKFNENNTSTAGYFYYSGTAPAPTIISFKLTPGTNTNGYINVPRNSNMQEPHYNTITIQSSTEQKLYLTTPNIYTSFNKAIKIFRTEVKSNIEWEVIRNKIRDEVRHKYAREWAIFVVNSKAGTDKTINGTISTIQNDLCTNMRRFIVNDSGGIDTVTFTFDSETGKAIGAFNYRMQNNTVNGIYVQNQKEDVGDMLKSNYIILKDRNNVNSNGLIMRWEADHPEYSYRIYHDFTNPILNISILYKNMYL